MIIYISKTNDKLNGALVEQELISDYICLNPNYPRVTLGKDVNVLMDSGAFQDRVDRVSFDEALERQLNLERKVGVVSERIVAYDKIYDSEETHAANIYLNAKRDELSPRQLVFMVQGNNFEECKACFDNLYPLLKPYDCVGIGGVAVSGRVNAIRDKLLQTVEYIMPLLHYKGTRDIHIFGVSSMKILGRLYSLNEAHAGYFNLSCDSSSAEIRSVMGYAFDENLKKYVKTYTKVQKMNGYHPCHLTQHNIRAMINTIRAI